MILGNDIQKKYRDMKLRKETSEELTWWFWVWWSLNGMALDISEVRVDLYPFMDLKDLSQMANLISGEIQRTWNEI